MKVPWWGDQYFLYFLNYFFFKKNCFLWFWGFLFTKGNRWNNKTLDFPQCCILTIHLALKNCNITVTKTPLLIAKNHWTRLKDFPLFFLLSLRICVITVAGGHPIVRDKMKVEKVDFQVTANTNRMDNKVIGKNKKVKVISYVNVINYSLYFSMRRILFGPTMDRIIHLFP